VLSAIFPAASHSLLISTELMFLSIIWHLAMIQERASLPIISLQPVVAGAAKKTSRAVGQATKTIMNIISRGEFNTEEKEDGSRIDRVKIWEVWRRLVWTYTCLHIVDKPSCLLKNLKKNKKIKNVVCLNSSLYVMLHCPHTILETIKGWCSFHFYSLLIRFYYPFYF